MGEKDRGASKRDSRTAAKLQDNCRSWGQKERRKEEQKDNRMTLKEDRRTGGQENWKIKQKDWLTEMENQTQFFGCLVASVITIMNTAVLTAQIQI